MKGHDPKTRSPAMAGTFYPSDPLKLGSIVEQLLADAQPCQSKQPKAVIAPHAGYRFSGPIAGSAFAPLAKHSDAVSRIVLLGPSHWIEFDGIALPDAEAFSTPLGTVPIDREAVEAMRALPVVRTYDRAHTLEHSLEVELPFLQRSLQQFTIVPLVVGRAGAEDLAELIGLLWGGPETRFVLSSDWSHYHDYDTARRIDHKTAEQVRRFEFNRISGDQMCGHRAVRGFLRCAAGRRLQAEIVDLRNSGDTAGPRDQVVGYGAVLFTE